MESAQTPPFGTMLRHEWRLFRADGLIALLGVLLLMMTGYALLNGHAWVAKHSVVTAAALADETTRVEKLKADFLAMNAGSYVPRSAFSNPSNALWVGTRHAATVAVLPPSPLAATAIGQSDLNPPYVKVSADNKDRFLFVEESESPHNLLIGNFDLSFVMVFLFPLLVIALSYNLISTEKERGTLSMLMANPVRLGSVVLSKVLFRVGLVLAPLLVFTAIGLSLGGVSMVSVRAATGFTFWALLILVYGLFWFTLAVLVNLFGKGSAQNALMLAGFGSRLR